MTAPANPIQHSFELAAERCEDLTPLVYRRLFREHPEAEPLFRHEGGDLVKGSMLALTIDMAYSHGRQGIRVNAIAPGHITTPMVMSVSAPGPRVEYMNKLRAEAGLLGTPGDGWDVGWAALFLASDEARWITGSLLPVDSGVLSVTPLMMAQHLRAVPQPD